MKKKWKTILAGLLLASGLGVAQSAYTVALDPTDDAYIVSHPNLVNNNYGSYVANMASSWTSGGVPFSTRSTIKFDLSSIPDNVVIISAELRLEGISHFSNLTNPGYQNNESWLAELEQDWDENTITWNNQPSFSDYHRVPLVNSSSSTQDYYLDVTDLVIRQYEGNNPYGWVLKHQNEVQYKRMRFGSKENTDPNLRPKLYIKYREVLACAQLPVFRDALLHGLNPPNLQNNNYENASKLLASRWSYSNIGGGWASVRSIFDVDFSAVPVGEQLVSAQLHLFGSPSEPSDGNGQSILKLVGNYNQSTVTWNDPINNISSPTIGTDIAINNTPNQGDVTVGFLEMSQLLMDGTAGGVLFYEQQTANNYARTSFGSSDDADDSRRPYVDACWEEPCDMEIVTLINTTVCGSSLQLESIVNSSDPVDSYEWTCTTAGVNWVSNATTPTFNFPSAGTYTIQLIVSQNNGCVDVQDFEITSYGSTGTDIYPIAELHNGNRPSIDQISLATDESRIYSTCAYNTNNVIKVNGCGTAWTKNYVGTGYYTRNTIAENDIVYVSGRIRTYMGSANIAGTTINAANGQRFIAKHDFSNGNVLGVISMPDQMLVFDLKAKPNSNNVYVAGSRSGNFTYQSINNTTIGGFIMEMDQNGNVINYYTSAEDVMEIDIDGMNNVWALASNYSTSGAPSIIKLSPALIQQSSVSIPTGTGIYQSFNLSVDQDQLFVLSSSNMSYGYADNLTVSKFSIGTSVTMNWQKTFNCSNPYLIGTNRSADLEAKNGRLYLAYWNGNNPKVATLSTDSDPAVGGNILWSDEMTTSNGAFNSALVVDNGGVIHGAGVYMSNVTYQGVTLNASPTHYGVYAFKAIPTASMMIDDFETTEVEKETITSIEQEEMEQLVAFPNPSNTGVFNLKGMDVSKAQVFNMVGALVYENMNIGNQLDMSHLDSGVYLVNFYDEAGSVQTIRLSILK